MGGILAAHRAARFLGVTRRAGGRAGPRPSTLKTERKRPTSSVSWPSSMSSIVSPMRQISPRRATRSTTKSASALAAPGGRRSAGGLAAARGLGAPDDLDGGADLAPLALVEDAGDHLPEVGLGLVVLAALAAHPDLVHDAPAPQRRQRHRGAARRDPEPRAGSPPAGAARATGRAARRRAPSCA